MIIVKPPLLHMCNACKTEQLIVLEMDGETEDLHVCSDCIMDITKEIINASVKTGKEDIIKTIEHYRILYKTNSNKIIDTMAKGQRK